MKFEYLAVCQIKGRMADRKVMGGLTTDVSDRFYLGEPLFLRQDITVRSNLNLMSNYVTGWPTKRKKNIFFVSFSNTYRTYSEK